MQNVLIYFNENRKTAFLAPTLGFEPSILPGSVILRSAFLPTSSPLSLDMPATLCPEEYGLEEA
jgi:hypothetical protein